MSKLVLFPIYSDHLKKKLIVLNLKIIRGSASWTKTFRSGGGGRSPQFIESALVHRSAQILNC